MTQVSRLLRNALLFILGMVGLLLGGEALARMLFPPTWCEQKLRAMDRCRTDVQVAVVGSSRATRGLDPRAMSWPAYNFGDDGQSVNFGAQVALRQAQRLPALKAVIFVLDEFSFGYEDSIPYPDYLRRGYTLLHPSWQKRLCANSVLYRYRHQLLPRLLGAPQEVTPVYESDQPPPDAQYCLMARSGLVWTPARAGDLTQSAGKYWAQVRNDNYERLLRPEVVRLLGGFVEAARARHLKVVLVQPPTHASYRRFLGTGMLTDYREDIARLVNGQPASEVCFHSYYDDTRFADVEFGDVDHLNSRGAVHWAQILSRDLASFIR